MALAWRWMIVGMMALFPITSHALALGKLKVFSALNEPLNAEIEFTSATEKEFKGLTVSLASRADFDAAGVDHRLGPLPSERSDDAHLVQVIGCSAFQPANLLFGDVLSLRAEAALLMPHVNGNLLKAMIEDADQPGIPARPDLPSRPTPGHSTATRPHRTRTAPAAARP